MKNSMNKLLQVTEELLKDRRGSVKIMAEARCGLCMLLYREGDMSREKYFQKRSYMGIFHAWLFNNYSLRSPQYLYPAGEFLEERMNVLEKFRDYLIDEINED